MTAAASATPPPGGPLAERLRAKLQAQQAAPAGARAPQPVPPEHYDFARFPELREYTNTRWYYDNQGFAWNMFREHEGVASALTRMDGREVVNFSSFNYLDLAGDARVRAAAKQAIDTYGTSTGSSRQIMGEIPVFGEFERELAAALGVEDALLSVGGYGANAFTIAYLARPRQDLILYDELVHNSALMGCRASGARRIAYPHDDGDALERLLAELRHQFERVLILTEGAFSMDGDIPDLPRLVEIKHRHKALLMVDEAHSVGLIGPNGMGIADHYGLPGSAIDVNFATLSKSFSTTGGYVAGRRELITMLKHYGPGVSLYSTAPAPATAATALEALRVMRAEPERRRRALANAAHFRACARAAGLDVGRSAGTGVVPLMIGDGELALWLAAQLFEQGVFAFPMLHPVVPRNEARLRFFVSAAHTEVQIERAVALIGELKASAPPSKGIL